jgi:hypothetical protein
MQWLQPTPAEVLLAVFWSINQWKAQGSIGHPCRGNASEVQRTSQWNKALRSRFGRKRRAEARQSRRSRQRREGRSGGDTETATGEGKASEGIAPSGKVRATCTTGNTANPRTGCGVQQTRAAQRGANRRSREERQGRNACRAWQLDIEGRTSVRPGVDAQR